jgi:nucleoside-diphosphate-sugar epimerase
VSDAARPTIAVTGGTGFIGRRLVSCLVAEGERVAVVAPMPPTTPLAVGVEWRAGDLQDPESLRVALAGTRVVYHLAGAHGLESQPAARFRALNVDGTRHVCAAATSAGVEQLIFTSTASVYGSQPRPDEAADPQPVNEYGRSKLEAEAIVRAWSTATDGRRATIVRPSAVIGPGAPATGGDFLRMVAAPGFALAGPARQRKSLAYVDNLAAFLAFLRTRTSAPWLFNYCDTPDLEVREIVAIVRRAIGVPPAPHRSRAGHWAHAAWARLHGRSSADPSLARPGAGGLSDRQFDATRAHASGFRQPVALEEALAATAQSDLAWMRILDRRRA